MSKPFFFRIESADLLNFATDPEGEDMTLLQFAKELQKGKSDIQFIQSIVDEAHNYIEKKKKAGSKGGKARASSAKAALESAEADSSTPQASSSTVAVTEAVQKDKKIYGVCENVKLTDAEHGKLGDKLNGSRERYIDKLSTYDKMEKYKDHYRVILGWYTRDQEENKDDTNAPRGKRL